MTAGSIIKYIDRYDGDVRHRLLTVYDLIRSAVPEEAVESVSWRMPTFKLGTEPTLLCLSSGWNRVLAWTSGEADLGRARRGSSCEGLLLRASLLTDR